MSMLNEYPVPENSLIFLSDEPGDAVIVERVPIVDEREEGSVTVGIESTFTDCKTGESRTVRNHL